MTIHRSTSPVKLYANVPSRTEDSEQGGVFGPNPLRRKSNFKKQLTVEGG